MNISELRAQSRMTRGRLPEEMTTSVQEVEKWESGKTAPTYAQILDLCLIFDCSALELLGDAWVEEVDNGASFAEREVGPAYGSLIITTSRGQRAYPTDERTFFSVKRQMKPPKSNDGLADPKWLRAKTLDNRILLINLAFVKRIRLASDDNIAMPYYAHPEVFRALERWPEVKPNGRVGGVRRIRTRLNYVRTAVPYAVPRSRHSARAAARLSLKFCRE